MDYPASVEYLYSLGNEVKTIKLGLERIEALLEKLGRPQYCCPVVHVAGTNGKGSVCAMIEAGLREAGYRTGFYTSPHLVSPVERIRVDNRMVTEEEFARAFAVVHECAEGMIARGELDGHPTYFETVTAMGFWLFREKKVERMVVEVGLGGRLDATNVVRPELSVITPVDWDHQQYLGDTIEKIAREKAGIIKPGRPVVLGPQRAEARGVFVAEDLEDVTSWEIEGLEESVEGCRYVARKGETRLEVDCPLAGEHQVGNSLTAAVALWKLGLRPEQIRAGIARTQWPGRLERVRRRPDVYLDGAHNIAAARALRRFVDKHMAGREVWLVFGVMRDKDVKEITEILFPLAARVILTQAGQARALEVETLAGLAPEGARRTKSVAEAVALVREAPAEAVVLITGSLFVVGEARGLLQ
ncbi:MAG: bifunctional folylpolyglutamate synthase/dihydrofolate synthase [Acidobacteriota bacterium]